MLEIKLVKINGLDLNVTIMIEIMKYLKGYL